MQMTNPNRESTMQSTRRGILKGVLGAAAIAGLAPQTLAAASTRASGEPAPLGAPEQLAVASDYALSLAGSPFGTVPDAGGGDPYASIQTVPTTPPSKGIGALHYRDITLSADARAPQAFFNAIKNQVSLGSQKPQSGQIASIGMVNGVPQMLGLMQMTNAVFSQVTFPHLDGANGPATDPFKVVYTPASTAQLATGSPPLTASARLPWSSGYFSLTINGTTLLVQRVEPWKMTIPVTLDPSIGIPTQGKPDYGDLVFQMSDAKAKFFVQNWFNNTVLKGMTQNYDAVLTILDPQGSTPIIKLQLQQIGVYDLQSVAQGVLQATCYVNGTALSYPSGTPGRI